MQFLPEKFYSSYASHQWILQNAFHLLADTVSCCHITCYGMKGKKGIFQLPFMAENDKEFSAKRFSNLSRTIFRSQQIEMKHD